MRDLDRKRERERDHVCDRSFNGQTTRQQKQQILKNPQTHTHARTQTHTHTCAGNTNAGQYVYAAWNKSNTLTKCKLEGLLT